ncbi:helix-turn-helix transcriptional regulator [Pseudovibrio sp. POLY-S9]|uniref:helix-turn-helix domain-containing protein n=1 Tax=Pseudovibrio sp. POLY-S9 TaxID=1576596 RepID=UPI00070E25DD|nr:helix-turn-helix transcriptional regulator [Pseudovibrio sp. POLY-S9]
MTDLHPLQTYLDSAGMRRDDFAATVGITEQSLSRIINRKQNVKLDLIQRIVVATGFAVSADDFLTVSPPKTVSEVREQQAQCFASVKPMRLSVS